MKWWRRWRRQFLARLRAGLEAARREGASQREGVVDFYLRIPVTDECIRDANFPVEMFLAEEATKSICAAVAARRASLV